MRQEPFSQWARANLDKFILLILLIYLIHTGAPERQQVLGAVLLILSGRASSPRTETTEKDKP